MHPCDLFIYLSLYKHIIVASFKRIYYRLMIGPSLSFKTDELDLDSSDRKVDQSLDWFLLSSNPKGTFETVRLAISKSAIVFKRMLLFELLTSESENAASCKRDSGRKVFETCVEIDRLEYEKYERINMSATH